MADLSENDLKDIVDATKANDGFVVGVSDVLGLSDKIYDQAKDHFILNNTEPEYTRGDFSQKYLISIRDKISKRLTAEVEQLIGNKTMMFDFYFMEDGEEKHQTIRCSISNGAFYAMVEAAPQLPMGTQAFDFLKSAVPDAYEEIARAVLNETASNGINAYLKEFPYQVYEKLT